MTVVVVLPSVILVVVITVMKGRRSGETLHHNEKGHNDELKIIINHRISAEQPQKEILPPTGKRTVSIIETVELPDTDINSEGVPIVLHYSSSYDAAGTSVNVACSAAPSNSFIFHEDNLNSSAQTQQVAHV